MSKQSKKKEPEREYQRLVEQETLIFEATELLSELIEDGGMSRKELAERLERSKGFVTQILAGDRNMTLRTLADFAFALEHRVKVGAAPLVESGHGGEAVGAQARVVARVCSGTGELHAASESTQATDLPRRPGVAEGTILGSGSYTHATYFSALKSEGTEVPSTEALQEQTPTEFVLAG